MNKLTLASDLAFKAGEVEGALPTFSITAYTGNTISLRGDKNPIVIDVGGISHKSTFPLFLDHNASLVLGQVSEVTKQNNALYASGVITGNDEPVKKVLTHAANGFKWQASVGITFDKTIKVAKDVPFTVNGRELVGPLTVIPSCDLYEISVVSLGADGDTSAVITASLNTEELKDMDNETNITLAAEKAELDRQSKIEAKAVELMRLHADNREEINQLAEAAIKDTTASVDGFELKCLRQLRAAPQINTRITTGRNAVSEKVIEAALLKTAGGKADYDEQTMDTVDRNFKHGLTLGNVLFESAKANGFTGSSRDVRGMLQAAFNGNSLQAAGNSYANISTILNNVANKSVTFGFNAVESAWQAISRVISVSNYKEATQVAADGWLAPEELGPGGEIKHGKVSERSYTVTATQHAKMLSISEATIINDDTGALNILPQSFGQDAARKFNTDFWTAFKDDAAFFYTNDTNSNYISGAATALSITALTTGYNKFMAQTMPNGTPLGVTPAILLVPAQLWITARQLMDSTGLASTLAVTSNGVDYGTSNPHAGMYQAIQSAYIGNSSITGYSVTAWYLLAAPSLIPVMQVAFLNGQSSPRFETAQADFNTLGIQMRVTFPYGMKLCEYRAGIKSAGA